MMYCTCARCCGDKDSVEPCINAMMDAELKYRKARMDQPFWWVLVGACVVLFILSIVVS